MENHDLYMKKAIELSFGGRGFVSPNPLVGAVIVKDGKIIGTGFHHEYGKDHAEKDALKNCTESAVGATLYCTLEPCCHTNKQTPPCTEAIIASGIKRVVLGALDPNPYVAGKGIERLKSAGIEVVENVLKADCEKVNEIFFKHITTKKPYVLLKIAQTLDGKMSTTLGDSKWITNENARRDVHRLRFEYDAIAIGAETLKNDNPTLTVRMGYENKGKKIKRLIFSSLKNIDTTQIVMSDEDRALTYIVTTISDYQRSDKVKDLEKSGVKFVLTESGRLDEALTKLYELKIASIMLEGGAGLATSFLKANFVDKCRIYIAPVLLGKGRSLLDSVEVSKIQEGLRLKETKFEIIDDQIVVEGIPDVYGNR